MPNKVREKIISNIRKSTFVLDPDLFKKLDDTDIWEFRTFYNKTKYRLLAFWDKDDKINTLVIATHGFIKKTQKTPPKEIAKAEEIRKAYFNSKRIKRMETMKFYTGEAIKQARQSKNLTQEELGNLIGVQRAQISRIENGKNLTFSTIARVFKAMGISAKLEIGSMGKVALW